MKRIAALAALMTFLVPHRGVPQSLLGFSEKEATAERKLESRFDSYLSRDDLRSWMKRLTARPHHTGSPYDKQNAEFIASQFRSWGFETQIEEFHVLFPTPTVRVLEMLEPVKFAASLAEPPLKEDTTSGQTSEQLPPYNAYSIDGDARAELVYVNYGIPEDYEELEQRGIDVRGKIVIARYGGSWRGIKPKVAAEHGAIGCIIYSDPRDDGFFQGDVYPEGAYRNEYGAQRGSVADMPIFAGDPLTPFVGATKDARRLAMKDSPLLTKIPVLPLSYADALPLLRSLGGPVAPEKWRGALPLTYHIGPGPAKVHLQVQFSWDIVPIYNVTATIIGTEHPEEWIIRGNHHDAWVNGAHDPVSGLVAMMAEARAIGLLRRADWRPKRTLVYAAWDAEEQGLMGSTEWAEAHAEELRRNAVAYVNSDGNARGFLSVGGSHTLEKFMNQVALDVIDPQKRVPVAERLRAYRIVRGSEEERKDARERTDLRIHALGSGSDYTPFIQHLGIACLNIGYGGEGEGGEYHSIYDSFDHYTRFIDPAFDYGITLAQTTGRVVLRLANAEVLPFEFTNFAETVAGYVKEVMKLVDNKREETEEKNRKIRERSLDLVADPTQTYVVPKPDSSVPHLNFAPLQNAVARLQASAKAFDEAARRANTKERRVSPAVRKTLNAVLMKTERALTRAGGLPGRPWFVHQIYAPGRYTGYGVKTLPGVREAVELRKWREADEQLEVAAETIEEFAKEIDKAGAILRGS